MKKLLIVLLITLGCPVPPAIDSGRLHSPGGGQFHWARGSFPVLVMVHPDSPPQHQDAVMTAGAIWNGATGLDIFDVHIGSYFFPMFNGGGARRGYVSVESAEALGIRLNHTIRGIAEVHLMPGDLEDLGVIHSAHTYLSTEVMDDEEIVAVAVHELGHCLGLAHDIRDETSIMWLSAKPEATIQPEDIAWVRSQY